MAEDVGPSLPSDADDTAPNNPNTSRSQQDYRIPGKKHVAGSLPASTGEDEVEKIILQTQIFKDLDSELEDEGDTLLEVGETPLGNPKLAIKDHSYVTDGDNTSPQHFLHSSALDRWLQAATVQLVVKSVEDDHLVCRLWTGDAEGDTDILVAKPFDLQRTPWNTLTIDDKEYTYTSATERRWTNWVTTELRDQIIDPPYTVDKSVIYATALSQELVPEVVEDEGGLYLTDVNASGRRWEDKFPMKARAKLKTNRADGLLLDCVLLANNGTELDPIVVARSNEMQKDFFDGLTLGGVLYTSVSKDERTAFKFPDTETHLVTPDYIENVSILIVSRPEYGTGLVDGSDIVVWQDITPDRGWAVE